MMNKEGFEPHWLEIGVFVAQYGSYRINTSGKPVEDPGCLKYEGGKKKKRKRLKKKS